MSDPQYYRAKANEMRENAQRFRDPVTSDEFRRLADDFERLAEFTESRVELTQPRYHYAADQRDEDD
ncbi:MAG TPA: hypothetical protein VGB82_19135 [Alphaproteobacteria bacterium]